MTILVTGAAGFIGYHTCLALMEKGEKVIAVDNLNDYYDPELKQVRLDNLKSKNKHGNFRFFKIEISDRQMMDMFVPTFGKEIKGVIHLAAQAGVRYSLDHPFPYVQSNITGHLEMLEMCRKFPNLELFLYASSSSVYGANKKQPFSVNDVTDSPISLYASTKKAGELMSYAYNHLYNIPMTGLRFFTVYGPWGRPDMAYFSFTRAIFEGNPIKVFNNGDMKRDFTYIDDIVDGILKCYEARKNAKDYKIYNLGNNKSEPLMNVIKTLENSIGKKAVLQMEDMQPGDVKETFADISESTKDFGFEPKTSIGDGIPKFIEWYKKYSESSN